MTNLIATAPPLFVNLITVEFGWFGRQWHSSPRRLEVPGLVAGAFTRLAALGDGIQPEPEHS